jgi:hypothetical protein
MMVGIDNDELSAIRYQLSTELRGYSSVGRAPALQAGGQEFESLYLHQAFSESARTKEMQ